MPIPERNANTHSQRKFFPIQWKELPPNPWYCPVGTKIALAFANIFMADVETQIGSQSVVKPTVWKRYIDDIFSLWDTCKHDIERFIWQANSYHPTIKFTAEIANSEASFLDTVVYKGNRFHHHSILDIKMHFKPTETFFQYTHFFL